MDKQQQLLAAIAHRAAYPDRYRVGGDLYKQPKRPDEGGLQHLADVIRNSQKR